MCLAQITSCDGPGCLSPPSVTRGRLLSSPLTCPPTLLLAELVRLDPLTYPPKNPTPTDYFTICSQGSLAVALPRSIFYSFVWGTSATPSLSFPSPATREVGRSHCSYSSRTALEAMGIGSSHLPPHRIVDTSCVSPSTGPYGRWSSFPRFEREAYLTPWGLEACLAAPHHYIPWSRPCRFVEFRGPEETSKAIGRCGAGAWDIAFPGGGIPARLL